MKDIKDYRGNELKYFVIANISALLYLGKVINLQLVTSEGTYSNLIVTVINSALFSGIVYILVLISDAIVPTRIKNAIVYWFFPLPGQVVFSKWKRKCQDERITQKDFLKYYEKVYENMPSKKSTRQYENTEWYKLYTKYDKEDKVFSSHRDYLMFRDMTTSTVVMLILYIVIGSIVDFVPVCKNGIIYLLVMYAIVNVQDIESGKDNVDFVLVFKLSRFGRNAADVLSSLQRMQDFGVNLICVEDGIDSSKDAGKLMISVLSAVAEIERENILVQTMEGRRQKARELHLS